ncbi:MAG: EAL domain-containing protein [Alphaproteobacteria bacterium]|nr:EAL domain-containing protein [Alphaproteobacteria bacterium]
MTALSASGASTDKVGDRDRFLAFSFCAADLLIELDEHQTIIYSAGAVAQTLGLAPSALIGQAAESIASDADAPMMLELLARMLSYGRLEEGLIRLRGPDGNATPKYIISGYHLPHLGGHYFISLRRQFARSLDIGDEGTRDAETGMLVGDSFLDIANAQLEKLTKDGESVQLATVELQDAEELRSRLDEGGRKRLKAAIGATLRANSVGGDMAGDLGDDRFALIHDKELDLKAVERRIAEQARALDPLGIGLAVKAAHVAIGPSAMSDDDATRALIYAIKQLDTTDGKLDVSKLSESLTSIVETTAKRMTEVRQVIADGQFNTVFQPVVKLRTRDPHHYEALARFDPKAIDIKPYEFVRLAEDVGLVSDFDLATTKRCLQHLVGCDREKSDLPIAVNLSGRSLSTPAFCDALDKLLQAFAPVRKRLLIEITETVRLKDFAAARNYVSALRAAGHKVCLDDFGAGEMQIDYLRQLDVDFVKIDGSYILSARKDTTNKVLLKAITSLCRELRIATIAEMVEDEMLLPFLEDCGVLLAQGYLFGRPMGSPNVGGIPARTASAPATASKVLEPTSPAARFPVGQSRAADTSPGAGGGATARGKSGQAPNALPQASRMETSTQPVEQAKPSEVSWRAGAGPKATEVSWH